MNSTFLEEYSSSFTRVLVIYCTRTVRHSQYLSSGAVSVSSKVTRAGVFHKLVWAGVETQTRHSLQHETHDVFVCLTKTRVHSVVPDEFGISENGADT